jgi:hypothetical protein
MTFAEKNVKKNAAQGKDGDLYPGLQAIFM